MTLPQILMWLSATISAGAEDTPSVPTCPLVAGWQLTKQQPPPRKPYTEAVHNTAVQLRSGAWRWNGTVISEAKTLDYLRQTAAMTPTPLNLMSFSTHFDCAAKRRLQRRIAAITHCGRDEKPCLEGTEAEYRATRRR